MRVRLNSYRYKQTGKGSKGVRDHFDEVLYSREYQRGAPAPRNDTIKIHEVPNLARLYQIGELEYKATHAIPDIRQLHTVCLIRDDITRLEVDVMVNSTDMGFSGMGTLDRTVFKKAGPSMYEALNDFGICKEVSHP